MSATRVLQYGLSMPSRLNHLQRKLSGPLTKEELVLCQQELCWLYQQCHTERMIGLLYAKRVRRMLLSTTRRLELA